ncbi:hypothetical protein FACS1894172_18320 [Spirochaetia bacterium]|nr:hypothetical protein FACS1894164_03620 [Spirochaetia bacterium]GHU35946.1 hypothetical protein FACS1894172_18320 [Spirochaetia bacterium]
MKRFAVGMVFVLVFAGMVEAQTTTPRPTPEKVTINGTLTFARGSVAIQNNEVTYLISGISQLIGFVDGLKAGAQVKLEGYAASTPDATVMFFRTTKLTFNSTDYDLSPAFPVRSFGMSGTAPSRSRTH